MEVQELNLHQMIWHNSFVDLFGSIDKNADPSLAYEKITFNNTTIIGLKEKNINFYYIYRGSSKFSISKLRVLIRFCKKDPRIWAYLCGENFQLIDKLYSHLDYQVHKLFDPLVSTINSSINRSIANMSVESKGSIDG